MSTLISGTLATKEPFVLTAGKSNGFMDALYPECS